MARRFLDGVPGSWWAKCAAAGVGAGVVMAIYEMIVSAIAGHGFWIPMNLIGAAIPAFHPPAAGFVPGPSLTGVVLHLITSAFWGLIYGIPAALAYSSEARQPYWAALFGMFFGTLVWAFMGLGIGPWIDPTVRMADPVVYAIGHLIYGVSTALIVAYWARDKELAQMSVIFAPQEMDRLAEKR